MYNVREITDNLYWIGANDHRTHLFENIHPIPYGVSYNSYLLLDEETVLFDTVDWSAYRQFEENLEYLLDGRTLDWIVINHLEPDHAASIEQILKKYPDVKIISSEKGYLLMRQFGFHPDDHECITVTEGDTHTFGKHTIAVVLAPMVHWPEVMVTYEQSEKLLFSADGFGKFGALDVEEDWACEARRYYFNIVGKYGAQVQALLKKASALDIKMILPLHGPILKEDLGYYLGLYSTWSSYQPESKGVFVAYASIHGNTAKAAEKLGEMLKENGAEKVVISDLSRSDMAENIEDAFRYDRIVLMASSYDGGVFPVMEDFLMHLKSKNYQNRKIGLVENGSWAPTAARVMKGYVENFKNVTIAEPVVTIRSTLNEASEKALGELAEVMAKGE